MFEALILVLMLGLVLRSLRPNVESKEHKFSSAPSAVRNRPS